MKWRARACLILMVTLAGVGIGASFAASDRVHRGAEENLFPRVEETPLSSVASFRTTTISIPTYLYAPALKLRSSGPYTFHWLDRRLYDGSITATQDYQLLVLDNDYLQVTILPELGGRVYQLIYKATENDELYQNPVIKPTHWGPLNRDENWWLAVGGIEWGLPVEEHGYEWGESWAWSVVTSTAGVTVTVRDTLAANRLRAAIDLFLPADRAYLVVAPHLENPTPTDLSYKYWTNAMLAPGPANTVGADLRFIFNSSIMSVHSTGDTGRFRCADPPPDSPDCHFSWPMYKGIDLSRLGNWRDWLGFFEDPQAAGDFAGVYDTLANEGVVRVFPSDVARGTKGFGFGWSSPIDWHEWADDGSTYVELHGGVAPTFWDSAVLTAGATLAWKEYWYPVGSIGVFTDATSEAALAIHEDGEGLRLGVHSTVARAAGESALYVWEPTTCAQVAYMDLPAIDPANPFTATVSTDGRSLDQLTTAYVDRWGNLLAGHIPANCQAPDARVEPLPPYVATPFTVTWAEPGVWSGIATYQVQARDGYEGTWTDWLSGTREISATYSGVHGHTYFFRARNLAGHQPAFGDEEWGQAFTTVLTQPAPVLVTSRKVGMWSRVWAVSGTLSLPTEAVSYTVLISNTGNLAAMAVVTDPIPTGMTLITQTLTGTLDPPPTYSEGIIHWSGVVSSGDTIRLSYAFALTPANERGDRITNTVEIAGSVLGPFTRQAVVVWSWNIWLPLVLR
jgi:uncharacterized repeat protein (TIGR01451 family)